MTDQPLAEPEHRYLPRNKLFGVVVPPIVVPVFLAAADPTVVATSLPAIAAEFGHVEQLSWVIVANLIASTIAAPAYGRLADLFGRRRMMLVAISIFAAAAVLCAMAPNLHALIAARVLQGFGAGGLMTLAQALIGEHVPPRSRGSYQGYLSSCIVAGTTIGPIGGGLITQIWGWHAVFLAYLPLCAVGFLLVLRLPHGVRSGGKARFDAPGMVLLATFVVPLLMAVSALQRLNAAAVPRLALLVAIAGLALAALLWQQRRSPSPLLALPLLRLPAFWRADVLGACSGASLTAMVTFLPIYLVVVTGASPAEAGLLLLPLTASVSSGSVLTGWLISRTGRTAIFPSVGLMVTALCMVLLALWAPQLSRTELGLVLAVGGLCQGSAMLTAQITVQSVADVRQLGAAAASVQLSRSLGSAFGAAAAGAVLFGLLSAMNPDTAALFFEMVRRGSQVLAQLPADHRMLVQGEIATAFRGMFLLVASFSCILSAAAWTMPVRRL